jgi:hypothetical protein
LILLQQLLPSWMAPIGILCGGIAVAVITTLAGT